MQDDKKPLLGKKVTSEKLTPESEKIAAICAINERLLKVQPKGCCNDPNAEEREFLMDLRAVYNLSNDSNYTQNVIDFLQEHCDAGLYDRLSHEAQVLIPQYTGKSSTANTPKNTF
jgi:hypothetical protein